MTLTSGVVYATIKAIPNNTLDVYALLVRDGNVGCTTAGVITPSSFCTSNPFGGTTALATLPTKGATLNTFGARLAGSYMGFDYGVEVPFQTGSNHPSTNATAIGANDKLNAYAVAAKANYTLPIPNKVNVGVEYDYATGTNSTDTSIIRPSPTSSRRTTTSSASWTS